MGDFTFDREVDLEEDAVEIGAIIEEESKLKFNIIKMCIMWSAACFCTWLMLFMNKYLQGSIYENFYLEGSAGIFGTFFAAYVYKTNGMKNAFIISLGGTLIFGFIIALFESKAIDPSFIFSLGLSE